MIESDLPFGRRSATMFMAIARDERLSNEKHVSQLPPHWGTLHQISRLDEGSITFAHGEHHLFDASDCWLGSYATRAAALAALPRAL